jgi:uridine phosphorylase
MIAETFLERPQCFENRHRGLFSCTGEYCGREISVFTTGMGSASVAITLPEAVASGATAAIIRVGSCGSLIENSKPGDAIIVSSAVRFDGASETWAPKEFPAAADYRVVRALAVAAMNHDNPEFSCHVGIECTTDDFYNGQGRPNIFGELTKEMKNRHQKMIQLGVACYSMEAASLFTWCSTQGHGIAAGAVNAVFANRINNAWKVKGELTTAKIALEALMFLSSDCPEIFSHSTKLRRRLGY